MKTTSEGEVRTALVAFLTTLTSILKTVKPLIEEATREELNKHQPKISSRAIGVSPADADEIPF